LLPDPICPSSAGCAVAFYRAFNVVMVGNWGIRIFAITIVKSSFLRTRHSLTHSQKTLDKLDTKIALISELDLPLSLDVRIKSNQIGIDQYNNK
jgi:hypothetical protein